MLGLIRVIVPVAAVGIFAARLPLRIISAEGF
jgi:hypothetical protein